jgi:hypothetical protein
VGLAPSIGVAFLFWYAMRAVIRSDRNERNALAAAEAEQQERQERASKVDGSE